MSTRIIIADDFTGAGDSGIHFARGGASTALLLDPAHLERDMAAYDALSLSTESRFLAPPDAAAAVRSLASRCVKAGGTIAYKKVDSTLRGNLGAEIEATLAVSGHTAALVCTAMPKTGRTCVNGLLYLKGELLHTTEIGRDPFNPVTTSSVTGVIAGQTALRAGNLSLADLRSGPAALRDRVRGLLREGCRVLAADAEEDGDLAALGTLLRFSLSGNDLPPLLPVGAGGLAEAFTGASGLSGTENISIAGSKGLSPLAGARGQSPRTSPLHHPPRPVGRMLAIAGSLTGISREQADLALTSGLFQPLALDVAAGLADPRAVCAALVEQAEAAGGANLLLRASSAPAAHDLSTDEGVKVAALFGKAAAAICRAANCPVLYATGGSTAVAVAGALGITAVRLEEECMPGVVLSSCADTGYGVRWLISKAGGFGGPGVLRDLASRFSPVSS